MYAGTRTSESASGSVDADSLKMLPDDSEPMQAEYLETSPDKVNNIWVAFSALRDNCSTIAFCS